MPLLADDLLVILLVLEDRKKRSVTEISSILNGSFELSRTSLLAASRATIDKRVLTLQLPTTDHVRVHNRNSRYRFYSITAAGLAALEEARTNPYLERILTILRELFIKVERERIS